MSAAVDWWRLDRLGLSIRPLTVPVPARGYERSLFRASLDKTLRLLATELRAVDAKRAVLELAIRERDLRVSDGMPRADARIGEPQVRLSFESKYGPLRYETGAYEEWEDNLRAIGLSLESLRAVDRYGVSRRGEQYAGWKQLPQGDGALAIHTVDQAWVVICDAAEIERQSSPLYNAISQRQAIAMAVKNTHPDKGGEPAKFRTVMRAKEILEEDGA